MQIEQDRGILIVKFVTNYETPNLELGDGMTPLLTIKFEKQVKEVKHIIQNISASNQIEVQSKSTFLFLREQGDKLKIKLFHEYQNGVSDIIGGKKFSILPYLNENSEPKNYVQATLVSVYYKERGCLELNQELSVYTEQQVEKERQNMFQFSNPLIQTINYNKNSQIINQSDGSLIGKKNKQSKKIKKRSRKG